MRVIGVYEDVAAAKEGLRQLEYEGFERDSISVLLSGSSPEQGFLGDEVAEGALTGTAIGGLISAIAASALALPGIGVIAAGPVVAALGGAGVGAASGGVIGALLNLGFSEQEAADRSQQLQRGAVIVAVDIDRDAEATAKTLLSTTGASCVTVE